MEKIIDVAVNYPFYQTFTYRILEAHKGILPGMRVIAPFGKKEILGIVIEVKNYKKTDRFGYKLKHITKIIDAEPVIVDEILKLCCWASNYYQYPIGQVIFSAIPLRLKKGGLIDKIKIEDKVNPLSKNLRIKLNEQQEKICKSINTKLNTFNNFLISGVTGSGKTEVYIELTKKVIRNGGQVLIIVPEINLTPQTIDRFRKYMSSDIQPYHSSMTEKDKMIVWKKITQSKTDIIIGTRSSIFLPFPSLKMIIVDEEHDSSLKQQEKFKYHARDLSIVRAKNLDIPVIIGSATPSFESLHNVSINKSIKYELTKRYHKTSLPEVVVVDLNKDYPVNGISQYLMREIKMQLEKKKQSLLYIGRRGFSHALTCSICRWVSKCSVCESFMAYHKSIMTLKCHHCGNNQKINKNPGNCKQCDLIPLGFGTQRIEDKVRDLFPDARIQRIDSDSISNISKLKKFVSDANENKIDILIGTQMLVKGHDFPNVSLVGIIDIDSGLYSLDFRGLEKTAQLVTQVSGRSGRKYEKGKVIIQTRNPSHPLFKTLLKHGYERFSQEKMIERKKSNLPPFSYISLIRASSKNKQKSYSFLNQLKNDFSNQKSIFIYGPAEAPVAKKNNMFVHQIILGSKSRVSLGHKTKEIRQYMEGKKLYNIKWSIDVDPIDLY
tara:strand:- start:2328 stop:4316 length:1989 start_codon:yes stop_codon:yes gene_type:complete